MAADGPRYMSSDEFARTDPARAVQVYAEYVRRARDRDGSMPPAEQMPTEEMPTRCAFCQAEPAEWGYPLDDAAYRAHSRHGLSPGCPMLVCGQCAELFDQGQDERLLHLFADALSDEDVEHFGTAALTEELRSTLVAFHAAVGRRVRLTHHPRA